MDETTIDNGCMWFSSETHKWEQIRPHRPAKSGVHVLTCDGSQVRFNVLTCDGSELERLMFLIYDDNEIRF